MASEGMIARRLGPCSEAESDSRRSSPEIAIEPVLRGRHILVDGFNLELSQGTGIKTYGRALIQALCRLGAKVSVLRSCRQSPVAIVQDAMLYEPARREPSRLDACVGALRSLARLAAQARPHTPTGWSVSPTDDLRRDGVSRYYIAPHCFRIAGGAYRALGTSLPLAIKDKVDFWHATYPLPIQIRGVRKLTTVHDMIPLKLPWAAPEDKRVYHRAVRDAFKNSERVLTVSQSAKDDIVHACGVAPERIDVTYETLHVAAQPLDDATIARQLQLVGLEPQSYLLFVGSIQPRKNLGRLCEAMLRLDRNIPLVVVGPKAWGWASEMRHAPVLRRKRRLVVLDYVSSGTLRALYTGALGFAFPSLYEGFGLPPLEAMAHDCPVLSSSTSSLREVCGDGALYVDPYDVNDLAEKLEALMADAPLRAALREKGRRRVEFFSFDRYCTRLAALYRELLR